MCNKTCKSFDFKSLKDKQKLSVDCVSAMWLVGLLAVSHSVLGDIVTFKGKNTNVMGS